MFRLINPDVTESECNARKETNASEGSLIMEYKSQAADGCEQCQKTENDLIECRKKLERTQRQLTKANDYNEDLRKQIHSLSSELHEFRSKAKRKTDVSTQAEFGKILSRAIFISLQVVDVSWFGQLNIVSFTITNMLAVLLLGEYRYCTCLSCSS